MLRMNYLLLATLVAAMRKDFDLLFLDCCGVSSAMHFLMEPQIIFWLPLVSISSVRTQLVDHHRTVGHTTPAPFLVSPSCWWLQTFHQATYFAIQFLMDLNGCILVFLGHFLGWHHLAYLLHPLTQLHGPVTDSGHCISGFEREHCSLGFGYCEWRFDWVAEEQVFLHFNHFGFDEYVLQLMHHCYSGCHSRWQVGLQSL